MVDGKLDGKTWWLRRLDLAEDADAGQLGLAIRCRPGEESLQPVMGFGLGQAMQIDPGVDRHLAALETLAGALVEIGDTTRIQGRLLLRWGRWYDGSVLSLVIPAKEPVKESEWE
jgi:hypothetical protein